MIDCDIECFHLLHAPPSIYRYGAKCAGCLAVAAMGAEYGVDNVRFFLITADGFSRAFFGAWLCSPVHLS